MVAADCTAGADAGSAVGAAATVAKRSEATIARKGTRIFMATTSYYEPHFIMTIMTIIDPECRGAS
jgi:hypothetical protein